MHKQSLRLTDHFRGEETRHRLTMKYVLENIPKDKVVLDLGNISTLSMKMINNGYVVGHSCNLTNDLDNLKPDGIPGHYKWITSFEVFEHLCNPYPLLKNITVGTNMLCSIPLNVWFSKEHWIDNDDYKQHYHEFSERQFMKLLYKTGWIVLFSHKHRVVKSFGIRQSLRMFWPSYLFVRAVKVS